MAKKHNLSAHELTYIKQREDIVASVLKSIEDVSKFKEGDYLIAFTPRRPWSQKRELIKNSYGAPKKFLVVHTDKNGIPYIKELNKNGAPFGPIMSPIKFDQSGYTSLDQDYEFEVDPDYADSIIMADEENYDAADMHRTKSKLFKEITEHNKNLKVKVNDPQVLINFLKNLKVGDVLWRSIKSNMTITQLDPIPLTYKGSRLDDNKPFGKAIDSKGKEITLTGWYFRYRAIYTGQPRSYNELKDPK